VSVWENLDYIGVWSGTSRRKRQKKVQPSASKKEAKGRRKVRRSTTRKRIKERKEE